MLPCSHLNKFIGLNFWFYCFQVADFQQVFSNLLGLILLGSIISSIKSPFSQKSCDDWWNCTFVNLIHHTPRHLRLKNCTLTSTVHTLMYMCLHQYDHAKLFMFAFHYCMLVTFVCIDQWQNSLYFCLTRFPFLKIFVFKFAMLCRTLAVSVSVSLRRSLIPVWFRWEVGWWATPCLE